MTKLVKPLLGLVFSGSVALILLALLDQAPGPERWSTVAGALAVIAACIGGWTAQDVVELELSRQRPEVQVLFDVRQRYGLLQLRVLNAGGGEARNIRLHWDRPLIGMNGPVRFGPENGPDLHVLFPGRDATCAIHGAHNFLSDNPEPAEFTGRVDFEDGSGRRFSTPFVLSAEEFRHGLTFDSEEPRTLHELQKLPRALEEIAKELRALRRGSEGRNDVTFGG